MREGEIGELWVRGRRGIQLFLEYYDNEEAMRKAFTDDGWFKTGDLVVLGAEGNFFYKDRDKDALKVGGENVSAREVEDCCRQAGGIADIAVVGRSHEMLDQVPVAFVIRGARCAGLGGRRMPPRSSRAARPISRTSRSRAPSTSCAEFPVATLEKVAKNRLRELADELAEPS